MEQPVFKERGRPKEYNFDTLKVGEIQHLVCKKSERDGKLKSARNLCSQHKKDGKVFRATATETGIAIKREA